MKNKQALLIFILAALFLSGSLLSQSSKKFKVTNNTGFPVKSVQVALAGTFEWGFQVNTIDRINNNTSFEFARSVDPKMCAYDIRYTDEAGVEYIMEKVDLCATATILLVVPEVKSETPKDDTQPKDETKPEEKK
jgi:NhaP-type Na+/H+ and K+/H+ antiporter